MSSKTFIDSGDNSPVNSISPDEQVARSNLTLEDKLIDQVDHCGIGSWHPKWMQVMANPIVFMANYSFVGVIQNIYFAYMVGVSSTLEKRFLYSSKVTGFIFIADNVAEILVSPVVGYLGRKFNKSILIAIGMIFVSFSSFLTSLPFFIYGPRSSRNLNLSTDLELHGNRSIDLCGGPGDEKCLSVEPLTVWSAVFIIWVANFLHGFGFAVFFTLGGPFIDDNVSKRSAPIYLSILDVTKLIGPTVGYIMSSYCLSLPEDFMLSSKGAQLTPNDPKFIGAWWLGFVLISLLILVANLPMFLFPTNLHQPTNGARKIGPNERKDSLTSGRRSKLNELANSLVRLVKNPVWVLDNLAAIFRYLGLGGFYIFLPKYLESQFRKSASDAALWSGTLSTILMAIGIMSGGLLLRCFKPKARVLTTIILLVELSANLAVICGLFLGCPRMEYFSVGSDLRHSCNVECNCSRSTFEPFCSSDGHTNYYSPCFAGCRTLDVVNGAPINCSCETQSGTPSIGLTKGHCPMECDHFMTYMSLISVGGLIASTATTANLLVKFRSVEPQDKSFANGLSATFMGLFAWIPYPIVFGAITDATCSIWQESCGQTGNCWIYDQNKFRLYLHSSAFAFMMMGTILDGFLIYYSKQMINLYEDVK